MRRIPPRTRVTVANRSSVHQRVHLIKQAIQFAVTDDPFTRYIGEKFRNDPNRLKQLYAYACESARFEPDPDDSNGRALQSIRSPRALFRERIGNCIDYSVFISSVLSLWRIPHVLRVSKLDHYGSLHIYPVLDNGIILDPVYCKDYLQEPDKANLCFNKEIPYISYTDYRII